MSVTRGMLMAERRANEPAPALTRNALIPISIVLCAALVYWVKWPSWVVIPIGIAVMALYLAAPLLARRSLERFDRDLVRLLATGKKDLVAGRFNRAFGMRLFAPPAVVAERKGMALAEVGDSKAAALAYQEAIQGYGAGEAPLAVRLGLAHASYTTGADADAIRLYRAILKETDALPKVARNLAHALARSGTDPHEARRIADELAKGGATEAELADIRELVGTGRLEPRKPKKKKTSRPNA
jgi:hypothetical protein